MEPKGDTATITIISRFPDPNATPRELDVQAVYATLNRKERLYAHHMSQAAWNGSRIIMRQTSPEAIGIFDFIMELYHTLDGQWAKLIDQRYTTSRKLDAFLQYAALFLCNMGNYYGGSGGEKFIPELTSFDLIDIARVSTKATSLLDGIILPMLSVQPTRIGYPGEDSQSNYYLGDEKLTLEEIALVSKIMEQYNIDAKNTRLRKLIEDGQPVFEVLQASMKPCTITLPLKINEDGTVIRIVWGDHAEELSKICTALTEAKKYAKKGQIKTLSDCIESFRTGSMQAFCESQKSWANDIYPKVESLLGFIEPSRDPHGTKSEWEGIVCVNDFVETLMLRTFARKAEEFTRMFPWGADGIHHGKGDFHEEQIKIPNITSLHALAFCASTVWEVANLPTYVDIRETHGCKSMIFANCMNTNGNPDIARLCLLPEDVDEFKDCAYAIRFITTAVHEILGHGTGKLLMEISPGRCNFDKTRFGTDLTWYKPGQTFGSVFGDLAESAEELRAILISYCLIQKDDLLAVFGYTDSSPVTADDILYYAYLDIIVRGLQALAHYDIDNQSWNGPHYRPRFAIFNYLLGKAIDEDWNFLDLDLDAVSPTITVKLDRTWVYMTGMYALYAFALDVHMWICMGAVKNLRETYDSLSTVLGYTERLRQIVCEWPNPQWKFVQPNTFLTEDGDVELRTYEVSDEGIIQSWAERNV